MALFGEKYGDRVRVSASATSRPSSAAGSHLGATGKIGLFKVVAEGAVASGVRRIEAVAGEDALRHVGQEEAALRESASLLKIPPLELPGACRSSRRAEAARAAARPARGAPGPEPGPGAGLLGGGGRGRPRDRGAPRRPRSRRAALGGGHLRERLPSGVICLGAVVDGKVNLVASVSKDLSGGSPRAGSSRRSRRSSAAGRRPARSGPGRRQGSREDRRGARRRARLGGARRRRVALGSEEIGLEGGDATLKRGKVPDARRGARERADLLYPTSDRSRRGCGWTVHHPAGGGEQPGRGCA